MSLKESGATLVEALAFTVIAIIFVISAVALWNMASNSANAQNAIRQMQALSQDIQDLFQNQDDFAGLDNKLAVDSEIVPEDLNVPNPGNTSPSIINAYGGTVTVDSFDGPAPGTDDAFTITFAGLPEEACINIATTVTGTFYSGQILDSGGAAQATLNEDSGDELPFTATTAQGSCSDQAQLVYYNR